MAKNYFSWFFSVKDLIFPIFFPQVFSIWIFKMLPCFLIFAFVLVCIFKLYFIIAIPKSKPTSLNQNQTSIFFFYYYYYYFTVIFPPHFTFVLSSWFILLDNNHSFITFYFSFILKFAKTSSFHATFQNFHYSFWIVEVEHPLESPSAVNRTHPHCIL